MQKITNIMCRYFILLTLTFLGRTAYGMDSASKDGWRARKESTKKDYQLDFHNTLVAGDQDKIKAIIENKRIPLDQPSYIAYNKRQYRHYYPIEHVIFSKWPASSLEALLKAGSPVDGVADYNPLKDIFMKLSGIFINDSSGKYYKFENPLEQRDINLYIDYIKILLKYNANIDLPFPSHNGFAKDTFFNVIGPTARAFIKKKVGTKSAMKQEWDIISKLFDEKKDNSTIPSPQQTNSDTVPLISGNAPASAAITTPSIKPTATAQNTTLTAPSNQPNAPQVANTPATVIQGQGGHLSQSTQSTLTNTVGAHSSVAAAPAAQKSTWYNKTTTFFADKTAYAAIAITTVTLAAIRLVYKNLISQDEQDRTPVTITVTNNTGSTIHVVMYDTDDSVKTTTLIDDTKATITTYWSAPVYVLRSSPAQQSRTPLSIALAHYKTMKKSEHETLHISIKNASYIKRWLSGSPYTYSGQWQ